MAERVLTAFAANQGPDMFNLQIEDEYAYIVMAALLPSTTRLLVIPVLRLFMMHIFPKCWIRLPMRASYTGCPWN